VAKIKKTIYEFLNEGKEHLIQERYVCFLYEKDITFEEDTESFRKDEGIFKQFIPWIERKWGEYDKLIDNPNHGRSEKMHEEFTNWLIEGCKNKKV